MFGQLWRESAKESHEIVLNTKQHPLQGGPIESLHRMKSAWQLLQENRQIEPLDGPAILTETGNNKLHLPFDGFTHIAQDGADVLQLRVVCPRRQSRVYSIRSS